MLSAKAQVERPKISEGPNILLVSSQEMNK
jgi:hypothetical protein